LKAGGQIKHFLTMAGDTPGSYYMCIWEAIRHTIMCLVVVVMVVVVMVVVEWRGVRSVFPNHTQQILTGC
jgi:uncharacterized membrane protein